MDDEQKGSSGSIMRLKYVGRFGSLAARCFLSCGSSSFVSALTVTIWLLLDLFLVHLSSGSTILPARSTCPALLFIATGCI